MKADGYSLDDKRNEVKENDIPDILNHWRVIASGDATKQSDYTDRTAQSFLVPFDEIKVNSWDLSINRYKEIVYEEIEYDAPEDIIAQIEQLDTERHTALLTLKKMLL